jgi:cytochrome P450
VYFDPYDVEIHRDPYPTYERLRDEAPLYYNERHDFYAVSRYDDVERVLADRHTFASGRGNVLEFIKSGVEMPPGIVAAEDPPTHTIHRSLMSRVFTPRKVAELEGAMRAYCAEFLDPLVGAERFDNVSEFATQMPMRVISMLIGWTAKVLADHPDQRRELVEDRSLIPNAVEEILRFENPAPTGARYVAADLELHDELVPAGTAMVILMGAANRDERKYNAPNHFDIRRDIGMQLTFGHGAHFCLGAALARLEGRIALDELLSRFPERDVDADGASMATSSTVRGWACLPVVVVKS